MAVRPGNVWNQSVEQKASEMEAYIDSQFKAKRNRISSNKAIIDTTDNPSPEVQLELRKRFIAVGWVDMRFFSEQRDGSWIELTFPGVETVSNYTDRDR